MPGSEGPRVAVFRPDDDRLAEATELLESLGVEPVPDPMLRVEPTGRRPRTDADYVVLTSTTGADLVGDAGWTTDALLCAIGDTTADRLREQRYEVAVVPEEFSSAGLVDRLAADVDGTRIEVARSDHGSDVLLDGLREAGAYVHETVLYRLTRPPASGRSAELAATGDLDGALFTSSLTVENFLTAASVRGLEAAAVDGLAEAVVGCIGDPTAETAAARGVTVDAVPDEASFEALARAAVEHLG